jgi:hypothetical protein
VIGRRVLITTSVVATAVAFAGLAPVTAEAPAGGDTPVIEVTDPGDEPRTKLRLDVAAGDEFPLSLQVRQRIEQEIDGESEPSEPLPTVREDMLVRVEDVSSSGRVTYTFELVDVAVVDSGEADPEIVAGVREGLDSLVGLRGEAVVNGRGVLLESDVDTPEDAPPIVQEFLDQLSQRLTDLTVPLPRAAVGVGASWTSWVEADIAGIASDVESGYVLREVNGTRVVLDVSTHQTAKGQLADLPGVPADADFRLTKSVSTGEGTITIDLTSLVPAAGRLSVAAEQRFRIEADGERQQLRQRVAIEITIGPEAA